MGKSKENYKGGRKTRRGAEGRDSEAHMTSHISPRRKDSGKTRQELMTGGVKKAVLGNRCGVASKVERGMDLISGMRIRFWPKKPDPGLCTSNEGIFLNVY